MESRYYKIKTFKEVKRLIKACLKTGYCCYDFETNAKPIYVKDFTPTILSITFQAGSGISIPLNHPETKSYCEPGYNWKKVLKYFGRKIIENDDPKLTKIGWNLKFDNQIWLRFGIRPSGRMLDGMLAKYILNEERPNDLKSMVDRYLPEFGGYEKEKGFDKIPWDKKPLEQLCKYGCMDTDCTFRLTLFFESRLIEKGLYNLYRNLIMPASTVLTEVERNGLFVNRSFNEELLESYKNNLEQAKNKCLNLKKVQKFSRKQIEARVNDYISKIEEELENLDYNNPKDARKIQSREQKIANIRAGIFSSKKEKSLIEPVNLGSPKQLKDLLFSESGFNLPIIKYTDKKEPSTDEDTLKELRLTIKNPENPKAIFLDNLLDYRGVQKMYTTFIEGWHDKLQDDSRLHGRFLIIGTTSGRLSSQEPNIQQIPKTTVDPNIKKQLIAPEGTLYMALDYSQAELRIMAHLSGDETYLQAFAEGKDPHLMIAAKKYGMPYDEAKSIMDSDDHPDRKIWKVRRKQAKQIAFGIIYGIQAKLLSQKLSDLKEGIIVTPQEAQKELDEFFHEHPKIKKYMKYQEKFLRKYGYVESLFGRKRRLPQVYSDDGGEAAYAVRLSVNMPCQSAASDMTLFASVLNYWDMRQGKFPYLPEVATVHDAVYYNPKPEDINVWTVYKIWDTCRNPRTKEYFNFSIDDIDMSMDFTVGRSMAEELPFIPGYDYRKMLQPDFNVDEYLEEHKKFKHIEIKDYPKLFKDQIELCKERFFNRKLA